MTRALHAELQPTLNFEKIRSINFGIRRSAKTRNHQIKILISSRNNRWTNQALHCLKKNPNSLELNLLLNYSSLRLMCRYCGYVASRRATLGGYPASVPTSSLCPHRQCHHIAWDHSVPHGCSSFNTTNSLNQMPCAMFVFNNFANHKPRQGFWKKIDSIPPCLHM